MTNTPRAMTSLRKCFLDAAVRDDDDHYIFEPGEAGLQALLGASNYTVSVSSVEDGYKELQWDTNKSLSWADFQSLSAKLQIDVEKEDDQMDDFDSSDFVSAQPEETASIVEVSGSAAEAGATDLVNADVEEWAGLFRRQTETVTLQSFLDAKFEAFMASNPGDENKPLAAKRMFFNSAWYYVHVREFYVDAGMKGGDMCRRTDDGKLALLMPLMSFTEPERKQIPEEYLQCVSPATVDDINRSLKKKWLEMLAMLKYTTLKEEALFEQFLNHEYFPKFKEELQLKRSTEEAPAFIPRYPVDFDDCTPATKVQRQDVINRAKCCDEAELESRLKQEWEAEVEKLSAVVVKSLGKDAFQCFHKAEYYDALLVVVALRELKAESILEHLRVPLEAGENATSETVVKRRKIAMTLSSPDLATLDDHVKSLWLGERNAAPARVRHLFSETPSPEFWEDKYYSSMEQLFEKRLLPSVKEISSPVQSTLGPAAAQSAGRGDITFGTSQSAGGGDITFGMMNAIQQRRNVNESSASDAAMTFIGSAQMHESGTTGSNYKYEGFLLDYDSTPRSFTPKGGSPMKRRASDGGDVTVLDVLLADLTGPVIITLWSSCVDAFLQAIADMGTGVDLSQVVVLLEQVRVSDMVSNDYVGEVLTPMKVLHSTGDTPQRAGTKITLSTVKTSPFTTTAIYKSPSPGHCYSQFGTYRLKLVPPFRATLRGTIVDASEEDVTLAGQPKKTFALVDDAGAWLQCVAVGRNALSSCLRNDMEVVAYYVSGKVGQRGSGGSVWLFKDSMLVPIGSKSIQKRNQLELMANV